MIQLISVDRQKNIAVFEQDGILKAIPVKLDDSGNPILDAETQATCGPGRALRRTGGH